MTSLLSDTQSMQASDILELANRFVDRGAGETDLALLLSSASDLLQQDVTGEKAKAKRKKDLATYTPSQVPSSSPSAPKSPKGTISRPTSPTASIPTSTAPPAAVPSKFRLL